MSKTVYAHNTYADSIVAKSDQAAQEFHSNTAQWGSSLSEKFGASSSSTSNQSYFSSNTSSDSGSHVSELWAKVKAYFQQMIAKIKKH